MDDPATADELAARMRALPDDDVAAIWLNAGPEPTREQAAALAECERRGIDF